MFKKIRLLIFSPLLISIFILLSSVLTPKVYGVAGCCVLDGGGVDDIACQQSSTPCDPGVKSCDTNNNVNANDSDIDLDNNGQMERYNTQCFIPIKAPSEVRITDFGKLFGGAVALLLLVAFILAFFFLILGGISWLTSGGDKAAVEAARNKIISAIIGLVIVAAVWALFQLVGGVIGYNILGGFKVPTLF